MRMSLRAIALVLTLTAVSCGRDETPPNSPERGGDVRRDSGGVKLGNNCPSADPVDEIISIAPSIEIQLLGQDPDGDVLEYHIDSQPPHGTVELGKDGMATFTRTPGFCGYDTFTYSVSDGQCLSDVATVTIKLNCCPEDEDIFLETEMGVPVNFQVVATDGNGDELQYMNYVDPHHGSAAINAQTGAAMYTPNPGYCGDDHLAFGIYDGHCTTITSVDITVCPVHDGDGDTVPDEDDMCPDSDVQGTIMIGGCNTGVPNLIAGETVNASGCTLTDTVQELIDQAAAGSPSHGEYISRLQKLLKDLSRDGLITRQDINAIMTCAGRSGHS